MQLYEPYTDNPSTRGVMRIDPEVLNDIIPRFLRDGWQVVRAFPVQTRSAPDVLATIFADSRTFMLSVTARTGSSSMRSRQPSRARTSKRSDHASSTPSSSRKETWPDSATSAVRYFWWISLVFPGLLYAFVASSYCQCTADACVSVAAQRFSAWTSH